MNWERTVLDYGIRYKNRISGVVVEGFFFVDNIKYKFENLIHEWYVYHDNGVNEFRCFSDAITYADTLVS